MNIIALHHDYRLLSLSRLSAPVKIIERTLIDIRWVEGMDGELVDEESFVAPMLTEEEITATIVEEETPEVASMEEEEPMDGVMMTEESLDGTLDCD